MHLESFTNVSQKGIVTVVIMTIYFNSKSPRRCLCGRFCSQTARHFFSFSLIRRANLLCALIRGP